jgi:phosphoribosylglycinamide formyltransferase-1
MKRIVVLISGRGSNMEALLAAGLPVVSVIANRADAGGLAIAQARGVATRVVEHRAYASREAFDGALAEAIEAHRPDLIVLAGFMRVLTPAFVQRFANRMINIHPSLLPSFTGLDTHRRALDAGVKLHGCTVHFVTDALDHGPIIAQAAVPVLSDDTESTLAARVLAQEHRLLPAAVLWFLEGRLAIEGLRVRVDAAADRGAALRAPEPA